jgi:ATP-binding cassette, subfamily F, member 3
MLTVSRLSKSFGGRVLFEDASLQVNRGDRIALIGPTDFSRLTKTMSGGWIMRAHLARLLVAEPELLLLDEQVSEQTARTILGAFLFRGDDVFKPVGILSGGEQSRLVLAKMLLNPPNFLLLDEPTTHLDMASIEALIQALKQYAGTLLFISHDVYFIKSIATSVLHIRGGVLTFYPGNYDYYLEKTDAESELAGLVAGEKSLDIGNFPGSASRNREQKRLEADARQLRSRAKKELEQELSALEERILGLESRQKELATSLEQPDVHENSALAMQVNKELKSVTEELQSLSPEWERLVDVAKEI